MAKPATAEQIKEEKALFLSVWTVFRTAIDNNLNDDYCWSALEFAVNQLKPVVEGCKRPHLKVLVDSIAKSVVGYIALTTNFTDHDAEAKLFNETLSLLQFGYNVNHDGEEADEDWAEIHNRVQAMIHNSEPRVQSLANNMGLSVYNYLADRAKFKFDKATEKQDKTA